MHVAGHTRQHLLIIAHDTRVHNSFKASIAVIQLLYSVLTLCWARGNQIQQYGYAVFGRSVAGYKLMNMLAESLLLQTQHSGNLTSPRRKLGMFCAGTHDFAYFFH